MKDGYGFSRVASAPDDSTVTQLRGGISFFVSGLGWRAMAAHTHSHMRLQNYKLYDLYYKSWV